MEVNEYVILRESGDKSGCSYRNATLFSIYQSLDNGVDDVY